MVLVRRDGIQSKFKETWSAPFEIAEVKEGPDSAVSFPGKSKPKVLHANLLKVWHSPTAHIHRVALVQEEGDDLDLSGRLELSDVPSEYSVQQQL